MTYKIDKNIPVPSHGNAGEVLVTMRALEPGDSFLIVGKAQGSVAATCQRVARQTEREFTQRKVDGGIRVWRVT